MNEPFHTDKFLFVGNQPCLDFINTEIVQDGRRVSLLENFEDLLLWLVAANRLRPAQAAEAKQQWGASEASVETLAQALTLRQALREMAEEIAAEKPVSASTLAAINALLRQNEGYAEIIAEDRRYRRELHFTPSKPEHLLLPIAEAAGDLLCSTDFSLVRKCENPACILYFYDTTKNHARRWCSMGLCGNRHKQAAHYRRKREVV